MIGVSLSFSCRRQRIILVLAMLSVGMITANLSVSGQPLNSIQVISDQTLESSTRVSSERRPQHHQVLITGGTKKGKNLFHSFEKFSLSRNHQAIFKDIAPSIDYVISRVTGGTPSIINGGIQLQNSQGGRSSAGFIVLNPHGIQFGPKASLNFGGSFIASTAKELKFDDGSLFSTDLSEAPPLLTISTPKSLEMGDSPQPINLVGQTPIINPQFSVAPKQSLILVGGNINWSSYQVSLTDARLELASLSKNQSVHIETQGIPHLQYSNANQFSDIRFVKQSGISISSSRNSPSRLGAYLVGNQILFNEQSGLIARETAPIEIKSTSLNVLDSSFLVSVNGSAFQGQPVVVNSDRIWIDNSLIETNSFGKASASDLQIEANQLSLTGGGELFSVVTGEGSGSPGLITVKSDDIEISGGFIRSRDGEWRPSGILTENNSRGSANRTNHRSIVIDTNRLLIQKGGSISTTTFNANNSGDLLVSAQEIEISGNAMNPDGTLVPGSPRVPNFPISSGLFTSVNSEASGNGGVLEVQTNRLRIHEGGKIQAATFGSGDAGLIDITADLISVEGQDIEGRFPSAIFAGSGGIPGIVAGVKTATGKGNDVKLTTKTLQLLNNGTVAVGSLNPNAQKFQGAGNLNIAADVVILDNKGQLLSDTTSGDGGNISLVGATTTERMRALILLNSGKISSRAGQNQTGGNGGNIKIFSDVIFANVDNRPNSSGNDIIANAFTGSGGDIDISAGIRLGIEPRPSNNTNRSNDIDASSEFGPSGAINLSGNVEPIKAVDLPVDLSAPQVARQCDRQIASANSRFVELGKGGLAKTPNSQAQVNHLWEDLRLAQDSMSPPSISTSKTLGVQSSSAPPIREAQGFIRSNLGQLMLVAQVPQAQPFSRLANRSCLSANF